MGIDGFHQSTKALLVKDKHISTFANQRIGIDASAWLHRGCVMYSYEIITKTEPWGRDGLGRNPGFPPWIEYPLRMIALLANNGVTPVVVFDGLSSPAKGPTGAKRRARKDAAKAKGIELIRQGNEKAARKVLIGAFDVTPQMTSELIAELKRRKIEFVVAPYEADAQLAYMASIGSIQGVITEDSDLFAYGCQKPILFKLCPSGTVEELTMDRLLGGASGSELEGWNEEELRALCVLSGCDFLPSIKGMGFKTALKVIKKHGTRAGVETLERTLAQLQLMDRWKEGCSATYCVSATRAVETFRHALVYDAKREVCTYMNAEEEGFQEMVAEGRDLTHLGPRVVRDEPGLLERVCRGEVCSRTFERIVGGFEGMGGSGGFPAAFEMMKRKEHVRGGIFSFVYSQEQRMNKENRENRENAKAGKATLSPDKKKRKGSMHKFIEFWKPA